jgi:thioredoxin reductase
MRHLVLMTTEYRSPESYTAFNVLGKALLRVPVPTRSRIVRVIGRTAVQAVEVESLDTGARRSIECDTVIVTGDWIPERELARTAGVALDPATQGPLVDTALRTSRPGIFAAGNLRIQSTPPTPQPSTVLSSAIKSPRIWTGPSPRAVRRLVCGSCLPRRSGG